MSQQDGEGFFARWSRRKVQGRAGTPVPAQPEPEFPKTPPAVVPVAPAVAGARTEAVPEATSSTPAPPPPTLEDAQSLTPASDFSRFVARDVPQDVRNAAVKKLFADPHFNVMDGLDIYIDDYTKTEPIPAAMLAKMVSAQFLRLVDDPQTTPSGVSPSGDVPVVADAAAAPGEPEAPAPAASGVPETDPTEDHETTHDDHADLQLQPDHAPGPQGPGPGAG